MSYYCKECKGTSDSYTCENPECPNMPCCGKLIEKCCTNFEENGFTYARHKDMKVPRYTSNTHDLKEGILEQAPWCKCGCKDSKLIGETPMNSSEERVGYDWKEKHECKDCGKIYWINNGT
mgnify:CR=1 FL=1